LVVKIRRTYPSGFYQAKVRIKAPDGWLNPIDGTVYAQAKDSSCFPDSWSLQKIQQEVAFVIKNKGNELGILTNKGTYFYKGYMTDGRRMAIVSEPNGIIVSAYPYLK
jgi:hypothetical protein